MADEHDDRGRAPTVTRRVAFENDRGETLHGRIEQPAGDAPAASAVFAHCFTCSKDVVAAVGISRALAGRGYAVLRFDFTGLGESEGAFEATTFATRVADLVAAAAFLRDELGAGPRLLVGHSLGGAAVIRAAGSVASVRAVATIGAPADLAHTTRLFARALPEIDAEGVATVTLAGREFRIGRDLVDDLRSTRLLDAVRDLARPLLVFHSPADAVVPVEHAARLYSAARHPKSFVSLDDADHLLSRPADVAYLADMLAAWAARYVGGEPR